jgi:LmbE family N-acetylglucosaminyl deacetylase
MREEPLQEARLMAILAHPDDESLGLGGTLAKYANQGVGVYLVTATRGERGRFGEEKVSPGPEIVGRTREAELRAAARELGLREVTFLDYVDKDLDRANPPEVIGKIVECVRRVRPQVVVTFGPDGAYGHPDHVAISQFATAAVVCAADPSYPLVSAVSDTLPAHRVAKFYYMVLTEQKSALYQATFRPLRTMVDDVERRPVPWPDWAVTTVIETSAYWEQVWRAVSCHKTQVSIFKGIERLPAETQRALWGSQSLYRVFSSVNGGRGRETDLFEGLPASRAKHGG